MLKSKDAEHAHCAAAAEGEERLATASLEKSRMEKNQPVFHPADIRNEVLLLRLWSFISQTPALPCRQSLLVFWLYIMEETFPVNSHLAPPEISIQQNSLPRHCVRPQPYFCGFQFSPGGLLVTIRQPP